MGSWGTEISSSDSYADIYGSFFSYYDLGLSVSEVSEKLIDENQQIINDELESNNFWFALSRAQWECNQLDINVLAKVKKIIESGAEIEIWKQLEASPNDIKKRNEALTNFLKELSNKTKKKSSDERKHRQPVYKKGECLTFKLANGNYGGAVVLEAIYNTEYGHNLIVSTRINQKKRPVKKDFENSEVIFLNFGDWKNKECIQWYLPIRHSKVAHLIEKIDNIEVQINYDLDSSMYGHIADFDIYIIETLSSQFKSEKTSKRSSEKRFLKELTKKNKWKFW